MEKVYCDRCGKETTWHPNLNTYCFGYNKPDQLCKACLREYYDLRAKTYNDFMQRNTRKERR